MCVQPSGRISFIQSTNITVVALGTSIVSNFLNQSNSAWGVDLNMPNQGTAGTYGGLYTTEQTLNNLGIVTSIQNGYPIVILGNSSTTTSTYCVWGVGCYVIPPSTTSGTFNNLSCVAGGTIVNGSWTSAACLDAYNVLENINVPDTQFITSYSNNVLQLGLANVIETQSAIFTDLPIQAVVYTDASSQLQAVQLANGAFLAGLGGGLNPTAATMVGLGGISVVWTGSQYQISSNSSGNATFASITVGTVYDNYLTPGDLVYATTGGELASALFQGTVNQIIITPSGNVWTASLANVIYTQSAIFTDLPIQAVVYTDASSQLQAVQLANGAFLAGLGPGFNPTAATMIGLSGISVVWTGSQYQISPNSSANATFGGIIANNLYDNNLLAGDLVFALAGGQLSSAILQGTLGQVTIGVSSNVWTVSLPSAVWIGSTTYSTGTVTTSGSSTLITCTCTGWTAAMVGANLYLNISGTVYQLMVTSVTSTSTLIVNTAINIASASSYQLEYAGTQFNGAYATLTGPVQIGAAPSVGTIVSPSNLNIYGTTNSNTGAQVYVGLTPSLFTGTIAAGNSWVVSDAYTTSSGSWFSSGSSLPWAMNFDGSTGLQFFTTGSTLGAGNAISWNVNPLTLQSNGVYVPSLSANSLLYAGTGGQLLSATLQGSAPINVNSGSGTWTVSMSLAGTAGVYGTNLSCLGGFTWSTSSGAYMPTCFRHA